MVAGLPGPVPAPHLRLPAPAPLAASSAFAGDASVTVPAGSTLSLQCRRNDDVAWRSPAGCTLGFMALAANRPGPRRESASSALARIGH
jgi:hypothetical protein